MVRLIDWLEKRRTFNIGVILIYFSFVIAMHDVMVNVSVWIMKALTRHNYDIAVAFLFTIIMVVILWYLIRRLKQSPDQKGLKLIFLLLTIGLIVLHMQMLFVINIEIIHSFQYGILALLIFPLTRSFGSSVFITALFGAIDELYQYLILYPVKTDYFDFNDVIINLLGAAFVMVFLFVIGIKSKKRNNRWIYYPEVISGIILILIIVVMYWSGLVHSYAGGERHPWLVLNKSSGYEGFWKSLPNSDITFHIVQPLEGFILVGFLICIYFIMDFFAVEKSEQV